MAATDEQPAKPDDALRTAALKEQVSRVTVLSHAMNLTVTHAMLSVRHAGERTRGRVAMAEEMRVFGRQLDRSLNELHLFIARVVQSIFVLGGEGTAVVYRLPEGRASCRRLLGRQGHSWQEELNHCREPMPAEWAALCCKLRQALHLAETALALVSAAKAESAGREMEASIRHVAEEVGITARRVRESVARMNASTAAGGLR